MAGNGEKAQVKAASPAQDDGFLGLIHSPFEAVAVAHRGRLVDASEQLCALLGYERDELLGLEVAQFVAPEDREMVIAQISSGSEAAYEHRALRKDGSTVYVEACARQVQFKGLECRVTALRDISERKRVEQELREREHMIRALVDNSQDWIWAIDINAVHTFCSASIEGILGYRPDEVTGQGLQLLHEDDRPIARSQFEWLFLFWILHGLHHL